MMKFVAILMAGATLALAGPALAEGACVRPTAPAAVDGATVTLEQLQAAKNAVIAFMAASDTFQVCVLDDLAAKRAAAKESKTKVDPAVAKALQTQVDENQADKESAGAAYNAAAKAYKAAHPA